ncbi:MAG: hypothetical protein ACFFB6_07190 [Promethearchaeota archaeon]
MQVHSRLIEIACPNCGSEKAVNIPETLFTEKKFGHIKIEVPQGAVCKDHVFFVLLDVKGRILGYQTVDLSIKLETDTTPKEEARLEDDKTISLEQFIDIIGFNCFAGLIHAKLFNYPLHIIINNEFKVNLDVINKVLENIMPEKYKNTRKLKTIEFDDEIFPTATFFYALVKNQRRTSFLMNPHKHIIQMPWKTGLDLEKKIINSVLEKEEQDERLKFLTFFISKFLHDVDNTLLILENTKKMSKKNLVNKLKGISITSTITKDRVSCIKEFIHRRISPHIAKKIQD